MISLIPFSIKPQDFAMWYEHPLTQSFDVLRSLGVRCDWSLGNFRSHEPFVSDSVTWHNSLSISVTYASRRKVCSRSCWWLYLLGTKLLEGYLYIINQMNFSEGSNHKKKEIDLLCHGSQSQCDLQKFLELGDMQYISGKNNRLRITLRMSAGAMKFRSWGLVVESVNIICILFIVIMVKRQENDRRTSLCLLTTLMLTIEDG